LAANVVAENTSNQDSPDYPGLQELWSDLTLGVGIAAVDYPHYPGSPQSDTLVAPLPYLEYEGDWLSIDRDGIQASLFKSDRVKLDISVSGSLPVNNDDDILREGMDDLELILEVGPELELKLAQWGNHHVELHLPLRAALELDPSDGIEPVGWVFDPRLHYEWRTQSTEFEIDLGAYFADQKYNQLLYGVSPQFETLERSQYEAQSGLVGYRLSSTIQYDVGAWSFLAYARYMDLSSAKNAASPLFVDDTYVLFGVGAIWRFKYADSD
jgi:outer membrane scaffolding protein for murein synthesis (MipA/OmpV family)